MPHLFLSTTVITDVEAFRALRSEWDGLLDQSGQRSFFLRWDWNWLWWSHFAPRAATLFLVCCRDAGGALVGVAPFFVATRHLLSVPVRDVHLLGTGIPLATSEFVDVFARRGLETAVAHAVARCLDGESCWDQMCLNGVPAESSVAQELIRALGIECRSQCGPAAPCIDTSLGWGHYRRTLGRSMRRNVEYYPRRLFRQHDCAFERLTTAGAVADGVDDLIRLHQARWQSAGEPGSFADPVVADFLRAVALAALSTDRLRLWVLRVDGRVEAALIGFLDHGILHFFQKGFNPAYARAALGTVMVALAVKDCCEDPAIRVFDFMGGAGYKRMWTRQVREMMRYHAWRANLRTLADRAWANSLEATARVYRAAAPRALRDARRRWHRRRRLARAPSVTVETSSSAASRSSPTDRPS